MGHGDTGAGRGAAGPADAPAGAAQGVRVAAAGAGVRADGLPDHAHGRARGLHLARAAGVLGGRGGGMAIGWMELKISRGGGVVWGGPARLTMWADADTYPDTI